MSPKQIDARIGDGTLIPEYRAVYRIGHAAPSVEARYMAAVKACGKGAVLSGKAAAYMYGLIKGPAPSPHVTAPSKRRVPGIEVRQSRAADATTHRGIPTATVSCVLVDLAADLSRDDLSRASHEAGVKYRTTPAQVKAVLNRRPNAKGAAKLKAIFEGDAKITLSQFEKRFLQLLNAANLPLPETNKPAGARRVDCRWPSRTPPLTVELDSYTYHRSRHAWEQDRKREREAYARGDDIRRYTWGDVFERPTQTLAELRKLLT